MRGLIHVLDPFSACRALVGLAAAKVVVILPVSHLDFLLAKLTDLWFEGTVGIVITVPILGSGERAVGTLHHSVLLLFVLFSLCFRDALAAFLALIVRSRAAYFMHPKFAQLDILLAERAPFCFDRSFLPI